MTDAPAACNISIQSQAVVFTARRGHHHLDYHVVTLVDPHLQMKQPAC